MRPSLLEQHQITLEDLVEEYTRSGSSRAVAEHYGCSERTVRRYLARTPLVRRRGPKKQLTLGADGDHGCLGSWLRLHPESELPHSVAKIATRTGCTANEVKCYLYRKRRELRRVLNEMPSLLGRRIVLRTNEGYKVPTRAFSAYKLYLNKWTLKAKIIAWLKPVGKRVTIEIPVAQLKEAVK